MRVTRQSITAMAMGRVLQLMCLFYCASMECRREQRATIKACVKWGYDAAHTYNALQVLWEGHTLSRTQVHHWFGVYTNDPDRGTADKKRPGRPHTARSAAGIQTLDHTLESDRRLSSRELGSKLNISHTSVLKILKKDLQMRKIAPHFVPHHLTRELLDERFQFSRRNLQRINDDRDILRKIVATDKTWCYTYDPRSKRADMQWAKKDEPRPSKPLRGRSQKKTPLDPFLRCSWSHFQGICRGDC